MARPRPRGLLQPPPPPIKLLLSVHLAQHKRPLCERARHGRGRARRAGCAQIANKWIVSSSSAVRCTQAHVGAGLAN
jgi:hypothetical protein